MTVTASRKATACQPEEISAVFASALATVLAFIYWLCRAGFDNPVIPVLNALSLSWFVLLFPGFWRTLRPFRGNCGGASWLGSQAWLSLCGAASVILAGVVKASSGLSLLLLFNLCGFVFLAVCWLRFLRGAAGRDLVKAGFGLSLLSLAVAKGAWSYQSPLFLERIVTGRAHIDTLFLSAISSIIQTYGVPSTGLDGLVPISYHVGSHWVFAQCAGLMNVSPLLFYQLGYQLIFVPLLFYALILFAVGLRRAWHRYAEWDLLSDFRFWLVVLTAFVGFLPSFVMNISMMNNSVIVSESYCLSLIVVFLGSSLLLHLDVSEPEKIHGEQICLLLAVLPLLAGLTVLIKISVGILFCGVLGYLFLRLKLYRNRLVLLAMSLVVGCSLLGYTQVKPTGSEAVPLVPFHFIKSYVLTASPRVPSVAAVTLFLAFHYFWTWSYAWLRIKRHLCAAFCNKASARQGKYLDLEAVAVLSVAGFLPGALMAIQGGSAAYFSDVQSWLSLPLLLAIAPPPSPEAAASEKTSLLTFRTANSVVAGGLVVAAFFFMLNVITAGKELLAENLKVRYSLLHGARAKEAGQRGAAKLARALATAGPFAACAELSRELSSLIGQPQQAANGTGGYRLLKSLQSLQSLPPEKKRRLLVYIPKTNRTFWDLMDPKSVPFVAPALAGIAMLGGEPEVDAASGYGYEAYHLGKKAVPGPGAGREELIARAASAGFDSVITIDANCDLRTIDCGRLP